MAARECAWNVRQLPFLKFKDAAKKNTFNGDGRPAGKWGKFSFPDFTDDAAFALEVTNDAAEPVNFRSATSSSCRRRPR